MLKVWFGYLLFLSFISSAVLGQPPMPTHGEKEQMCEKEALDGCLDKLKTFLKISTLPFTSDQKQLDLLCEKALSGHNCSQSLYKNADCLLQKDKDMIPIFTPMAEYMYYMLCGDGRKGSGYLRDAFLSSSDCLRKHKDKINCCAKETNIPDTPILRFLEQSGKTLQERSTFTCCPMSRHLQCVSAVAKDFCGEAALNFTSEYIQRAAGEQVQIVCQKLPDYPDTDSTTCPDPVKICSGCIKLQYWNLILSHFFVILVMWVFKTQVL